MTTDIAALRSLFEPSVQALGYELVHLDMARQDQSSVLRVYIDAPGGIRVDDCATVSRQLSAALDVEEALPPACRRAYQLEVSSPGLDRPLIAPGHFRRFIGRRARIVLKAGARRRLRGKLLEADDLGVALQVDGERCHLAYSEIETARLEPVF